MLARSLCTPLLPAVHPDPANKEDKVDLDKVIPNRKHRALLSAWFAGVRTLYVTLRSLAAPRLRGELRARRRRLEVRHAAAALCRLLRILYVWLGNGGLSIAQASCRCKTGVWPMSGGCPRRSVVTLKCGGGGGGGAL
jgi:hypothetical protein